MRWPFGPPHLTLKPSKKNQKTKKKPKKQTKKNTKIPKKRFSVISQNFFFLGGGVQKLPFLTTWPRKRAPPKHYKNRGFSLFFEKKLYVTKRPFSDLKNPNPEIPVIIFFLPFFSLSTTKNTKISWNPYFYCVLANLKKENIQILNLKHRKLKNPIFAPFFWKKKAIFR